MILLGWKIGTGERVEIPETGHLAWFGQTQLSGKTTALEAIAYRGELRAVAFITKQGEGGFLTGRMIPPYFSEPTNDEEQPLWRWVKSILEASQQRKMNFEESWIIRACEDPRQAKTLADVHQNIKDLLAGEGGYVEKGRGKKKKREWKYTRKPVTAMNAGIYTSLKAYFDIVMPQLARLPYTKKLVLGDGLNVMDLREYAMETQALVIRSVMEWVYQHEKGVRVIVPEAQDFVPQGKNSPVKMACETLVRKAGANKNFMWLDSQDMAAVDKIMLRACSIVGIGVQTEGHEIDRSLASLFTPALKAVDIARLRIGEFFVRTPEAKVSKVYVQPAWMESELHAQAIAKGEERVESARQMLRAFKDSRSVTIHDGIKTAGNTKMLVGASHAMREYPPHELKQILSQESPADAEETESVDENVSGTRSRQSEDEVRVSVAVSAPHRDRESGNQSAGNPHRYETPEENETEDYESRATSGKFQTEKKTSQILNETEPGKHENETPESPGDPGAGEAAIGTEDASEEIPVDASVSGTLFRGQFYPDGASRTADESESPMPQAETPTLKNALNFLEHRAVHDTPGLFNTLVELIRDHRKLIEAHDVLAARVRAYEEHEFETGADIPMEHGVRVPELDPKAPRKFSGLVYPHPDDPPPNGNSLEKIYAYVKSRAAIDPGILEILTHRPEIRVKVERTVIHANGNTLDGRVALLVHEGFFDKPKTRVDVGNELRRRGALESKANLKILSPRLSSLAEKGFLTIEGDAYKSVPEMKAKVQKA